MTGYVDELRVEHGRAVLRGWAIDESGNAPAQLVVGIGAERTFVDVGDVAERTDVQRHLALPHARLGYTMNVPAPTVKDIADMGRIGFSVTLPSGRPLRMAQSVARALRGLDVDDEDAP
jgi:hypothetical protein